MLNLRLLRLVLLGSHFCISLGLAICGCRESVTEDDVADRIPPGRVEDLLVSVMDRDAVLLIWTAPGDDGRVGQATSYEIRHSLRQLTPTNWESAAIALSGGTPESAGHSENVRLQDVGYGDRYFAIRASDEAGNLSDLSNVVRASLVDVIPPSRVTDLRAVATDGSSVRLTWTAPGGDGNLGRASRYEVRYGDAPISEDTWSNADSVAGPPQPAFAGNPESLTIDGLRSHSYFYFALKAVDGGPNWSEVSNDTTATLGLRRLTTSPPGSGGAGNPAWSPTGERIAFHASWDGDGAIYTVSVDGTNPVRITPTDLHCYDPFWSPDGAYLGCCAYSVTLRRPNIWVMEAAPGAVPREVVQQPNDYFDGAWSPDGEKIAFSGGDTPPFSDIRSYLFIVQASGGRYTGISPWRENDFGPTWSPDGSTVAFASDRSGGYHIWTLSPLSHDLPVQITHASRRQYAPDWSRDGTRIAYISVTTVAANLWTMSEDGTDPIQLTFGGANDNDPSWSPDGRNIAFASRRDGISEIWIVTLD